VQERGYQKVDSHQDLLAVETGQLLGLFPTNSLSPEVDQPAAEPSLDERTREAIELLGRITDRLECLYQ
jgi:alkaline phosphatase